MAFYDYREDFDRGYSTTYNTCYDYSTVPVKASSDYSSPYGSGEPLLAESTSSAFCTNDSFATPLELSYSVYTYSEPKVLHYDPIEDHPYHYYYQSSANPSEIQPKFYQHSYFPSETKFTISYSSVEFNESEFEEFDPTPYGGGYDPVTTYGKPLPPSDATCYPRTVPQPDLENFSYSSIPSPYGKDDDLPSKPPNGTKPVVTTTETETETHTENGDMVTSDGEDVGPDVVPSNGLENGHQNGLQNGSACDYGYGQRIPYGSGLEAMDLCESIFGYWPCLAKSEQQVRNKCRLCDQERRTNPWESAANYLFGSPIVYGCENYHGPQYFYDQNSWLQ